MTSALGNTTQHARSRAEYGGVYPLHTVPSNRLSIVRRQAKRVAVDSKLGYECSRPLVAIWSASSEERRRNCREQLTSRGLYEVICCPLALFLCSSAQFSRQMGRDGETPTAGIERRFVRSLEDCRMRISRTFRGIEHISARSTTKIERCSFRVWAVFVACSWFAGAAAVHCVNRQQCNGRESGDLCATNNKRWDLRAEQDDGQQCWVKRTGDGLRTGHSMTMGKSARVSRESGRGACSFAASFAALECPDVVEPLDDALRLFAALECLDDAELHSSGGGLLG
ncbi:hypothetical protein BDZ97DRAFT_1766955 [Flammula alnicola]|nr:hypothetical protein BDZ97DRAFT_1766955 [Flammula alnicola]